jgi:hypothetical protein
MKILRSKSLNDSIRVADLDPLDPLLIGILDPDPYPNYDIKFQRYYSKKFNIL